MVSFPAATYGRHRIARSAPGPCGSTPHGAGVAPVETTVADRYAATGPHCCASRGIGRTRTAGRWPRTSAYGAYIRAPRPAEEEEGNVMTATQSL